MRISLFLEGEVSICCGPPWGGAGLCVSARLCSYTTMRHAAVVPRAVMVVVLSKYRDGGKLLPVSGLSPHSPALSVRSSALKAHCFALSAHLLWVHCPAPSRLYAGGGKLPMTQIYRQKLQHANEYYFLQNQTLIPQKWNHTHHIDQPSHMNIDHPLMKIDHHKITSIHPPPPKKSPSLHHIVTSPPLSCAAVPAHSPARGSVPPRLRRAHCRLYYGSR